MVRADRMQDGAVGLAGREWRWEVLDGRPGGVEAEILVCLGWRGGKSASPQPELHQLTTDLYCVSFMQSRIQGFGSGAAPAPSASSNSSHSGGPPAADRGVASASSGLRMVGFGSGGGYTAPAVPNGGGGGGAFGGQRVSATARRAARRMCGCLAVWARLLPYCWMAHSCFCKGVYELTQPRPVHVRHQVRPPDPTN